MKIKATMPDNPIKNIPGNPTELIKPENTETTAAAEAIKKTETTETLKKDESLKKDAPPKEKLKRKSNSKKLTK